jgi:DNA modification methylase
LSKDTKNSPKIELIEIGKIRPYEKNPRTHSKAQLKLIESSIKRFGIINPIVIDGTGYVICGHGRLEALTRLGVTTIPIIRVEHLTEAEVRAYRLADNRIAESAGWDGDLLAFEIRSLVEVDFDLELTGFSNAEIDSTLCSPQAPDPADEIPKCEPPVSQHGDLWVLGDHRLLCDDSLKVDSFRRLLSSARAQMVFTDPPWNVTIDGNVCGLGSIKHREFAMASGEMSTAEFGAFLVTALRHLSDFSVDGSIHYVCIDWRHLRELLTSAMEVNFELKNICVWNKTNGGMGSLYRSKHELILCLKRGTAPHINNIDLGRYGRNRTNLWDYPGASSLNDAARDDLALHPTVKPIALVADAILDCSKRGGVIVDCFSGSGSTLLAAERTGRRGYGIEIDPMYVDVAIRRYQNLTGQKAVHLESGISFEDAASQRMMNRPDNATNEGDDCGRR